MAHINVGNVADFILAVVTVSYAIKLVYVKLNPESVKHKLGPDARGYHMYQKVYSTQFLEAWVLITLVFVLNLTLDIFKSINRSIPFCVETVSLTGGFVLSVVALYFIYTLFKE